MKSKVTSEEACLVSWNAATFREKKSLMSQPIKNQSSHLEFQIAMKSYNT
jgi:hypothetical protein